MIERILPGDVFVNFQFEPVFCTSIDDSDRTYPICNVISLVNGASSSPSVNSITKRLSPQEAEELIRVWNIALPIKDGVRKQCFSSMSYIYDGVILNDSYKQKLIKILGEAEAVLGYNQVRIVRRLFADTLDIGLMERAISGLLLVYFVSVGIVELDAAELFSLTPYTKDLLKRGVFTDPEDLNVTSLVKYAESR